MLLPGCYRDGIAILTILMPSVGGPGVHGDGTRELDSTSVCKNEYLRPWTWQPNKSHLPVIGDLLQYHIVSSLHYRYPSTTKYCFRACICMQIRVHAWFRKAQPNSEQRSSFWTISSQLPRDNNAKKTKVHVLARACMCADGSGWFVLRKPGVSIRNN